MMNTLPGNSNSDVLDIVITGIFSSCRKDKKKQIKRQTLKPVA